MSGTSTGDGFSIIELLLMVVILGILATIVALSVGGLTTKADETACRADRRQLEKATEAYFARYATETIPATGTVEPYEQTLVDAEFLRQTSQYYELDAYGQLTTAAGSYCPT